MKTGHSRVCRFLTLITLGLMRADFEPAHKIAPEKQCPRCKRKIVYAGMDEHSPIYKPKD